ncbi:ComEA family DNA-binding protein [Deinococcus ruber]|uniref:Competence protein ComEA n=1 Tax=Deinococcus ruber TaxID=1848197 RepID=A0A918F2T7_9DEIO|nr:helix-hairpin-helix domain-containing protein [Deinococcus ruber]GGQ96281.1 hypothetical protein GCM10008957_05660 [Deinococcus ruber]
MKRSAHILLGLLTAVTLTGTALAASGTTTATTPATTMKMPKPTVALPPAGFKVNVNTGSAADLLKVPGLSQKVVDDLIKNRPFKDQAELVKKVRGIGPKNVLKMAPYFTY